MTRCEYCKSKIYEDNRSRYDTVCSDCEQFHEEIDEPQLEADRPKQIPAVIGCAISKKPFEIKVTGEGFENGFIIKKESDLKDVYDIIELLKYKL